MNATATTCAELYACNPTFASGIAAWVANRRCPLELADFLMEFGFDAAADCARWAAIEPDRPVCTPLSENHGERGGECGPFPSCELDDDEEWGWASWDRSEFEHKWAFCVPVEIKTIRLPSQIDA